MEFNQMCILGVNQAILACFIDNTLGCMEWEGSMAV